MQPHLHPGMEKWPPFGMQIQMHVGMASTHIAYLIQPLPRDKTG